MVLMDHPADPQIPYKMLSMCTPQSQTASFFMPQPRPEVRKTLVRSQIIFNWLFTLNMSPAEAMFLSSSSCFTVTFTVATWPQ